MYIVVQHTISDPVKFLKGAEEVNKKIPPNVKLHHVFSAPDGTRAGNNAASDEPMRETALAKATGARPPPRTPW